MRMQNSWYNVFNKMFRCQYGPLQLYKTDDEIIDLLLVTAEHYNTCVLCMLENTSSLLST